MIDIFFPANWDMGKVLSYLRERFNFEPYPWHYWDGVTTDEFGEVIQYVQTWDEDCFINMVDKIYD